MAEWVDGRTEEPRKKEIPTESEEFALLMKGIKAMMSGREKEMGKRYL